MIEFVKAHACGNDFLIVEATQVAGRDLTQLARELCSRTTGIGADGVEYLTQISDSEGRIRLHNADGSHGEISGNGTRCVAAWLAYRGGLQSGDEVRIETDAGVRIGRLERVDGAEFRFTTGMGVPQVRRQRVKLGWGMTVESAFVDMGNPQFIVMLKDEDFAMAGRSWQDVGGGNLQTSGFSRGDECGVCAASGGGPDRDSHIRARSRADFLLWHRDERKRGCDDGAGGCAETAACAGSRWRAGR